MDRDTLLESIRYRCWQRGEDYEAFVTEYSSEQELLDARASANPDEQAIAFALIDLRHVLRRIRDIADRFPDN